MDGDGRAGPVLANGQPLERTVKIHAVSVVQSRAADGLGHCVGRHGDGGLEGEGVEEADAARGHEAPLRGVEAPGRQEADGVGGDVDGGADLAAKRGPLVHVDAVACSAEGDGGGEAGDSGTDDEDGEHGGGELAEMTGFRCWSAYSS